jgi:hypothetical protein
VDDSIESAQLKALGSEHGGDAAHVIYPTGPAPQGQRSHVKALLVIKAHRVNPHDRVVPRPTSDPNVTTDRHGQHMAQIVVRVTSH